MRVRSKLAAEIGLRPPVAGLIYLGWAAALGLVELLGRQSPNDLADGCLLSLVAGGLCLAWMCDPWHLLHQGLVGGLALVRRAFSGSRILFGIDFRETAPLPNGFPPWWRRMVFASLAVTAGLVIGSIFWSGNLRLWLTGGSYLIYLIALAATWTGLSAAFLVNAFIGFAVIHDFCVEAYAGQPPRPLQWEVSALAGSAATALAGSLLLGPGIPLGVMLTVAIMWMISFTVARVGFSVQWTSAAGQPLKRFDGRWLWAQWGLLFLWTMAVVLLAVGGRAWDVVPRLPQTVMPFTLFFGGALAWLAAITSMLLLGHWLRMVWMMTHLSPCRPRFPTLVISGPLRKSERRGLSAALEQQGWTAEFHRRAGGRRHAAVALTPERLADLRRQPAWFRDPGWLASVCDAEQLFSWRRRAEIQWRRQMLRGLEKLSKRMKRCRKLTGTGYWLGLQHAFILGLARDETDHTDWGRETTILDEIIGQPFYAVIPPAARYHYRQIAAALQIDLVFVEDGVSFRRLVRVLRMMFEIYDLHGGRMPAREHHFLGLPGIRVILHEYQLDDGESHGRSGYPEPEYEEIGHARILHVFKDRGETIEPVHTPDAADWTPVGSLC